jgi:hypothetical protein
MATIIPSCVIHCRIETLHEHRFDADLEGFHLISRERSQKITGRLFRGLSIQPAVEVARMQDDGHAIMHGEP